MARLLIIILPLALLAIFIAIAVREEKNNMNNKNNAKYAFYYLLSLVALIFLGLSVGMIAFGIINQTIPDALNNYLGSDGQLKFAISAILIAAPIYYWLSWLISRGLRRNELDKESGLRRWLTYFILLVSSVIILGEFISVINNLLSGELGGRFVLKALVVLFISGTVFVYYFYDMKREVKAEPSKANRVFFFASLAVVLATFIAAWFFVESPQIARARRLDQALVGNIYSLESVINNYYTSAKKLPENLAELQADQSIYLDSQILSDPETKAPIEYKKTAADAFELCATFRLDSSTGKDGSSAPYYAGDNKNHRAGYQCLKGNLYAVPVKPLIQ